MAEKFWLDLPAMTRELDAFFDQRTKDLTRFGSKVNQVFEAFVFAQAVAWHREHGWTIEFKHPAKKQRALVQQTVTPPPPEELKLKFNTRGKPSNYSYALCSKGAAVHQVRHGLRVMTHSGAKYDVPKANMVLDVAVIKDTDLSWFTTDTPLPNNDLITFGEAKHMSAFAELVASFLGMAAEMQPGRLRMRSHGKQARDGLLPFLYVSGFLAGTAAGLEKTIRQRGFAVDIYSQTKQLAKAVRLSVTKPAPSKKRTASS